MLVGDVGQLEPIGDWSMCDLEATYQSCPKSMRHIWRHACQGKLRMLTFADAVIFTRIHRSKEDMWWTGSCLRLHDFMFTKDGDYEHWQGHVLDRGHLSTEQKRDFEEQAVWLCARCEDVGG